MRPPARRGFTFMELTVVIAIIGILASMLFPVFARAREMARRSQCAANVAELGLALQMYASDWGGAYPPQQDNLGPIAERVDTDAIFRCPSSIMGGLTRKERAVMGKAEHVRFLETVAGQPPQENTEYSPVLADGRLLGSAYYYHAGLTTASPPDQVLVTEREAAHMGCANVLYVSGRLARVPEAQWRTLLPAWAIHTEDQFEPEGGGLSTPPPMRMGGRAGQGRMGRGGQGGRT